MGQYFEYDRIIEQKDFCNYEKEKKWLQSNIDSCNCIKIYGRRNFGKTSLIKNIIASDWVEKGKDNRVVLYIDLYSVKTLEDISKEVTLAFNLGISKNIGLFDKDLQWIKALKNLRPTWSPPLDDQSFGEFSIKSLDNNSIVSFQTIFENINELKQNKDLDFLVIMDEFQQISEIPKAEAMLRHSLQLLDSKIPVVILGSKYHLLSKIFNTPQAPFYSWGNTLELGPIDYQVYTNYINERFTTVKKSLDINVSIYLQDKLFRIPEAINRLCDYLAKDESLKEINERTIDQKLIEFLDFSRSIYEENFSRYSRNQQQFLTTLAHHKKIIGPSSKEFNKAIPNLAKSTLHEIGNKLLDDGVIERTDKAYRLADPFFDQFLRTYKII